MDCGEEESENGANILELSGISSTNFAKIAKGKIDLNFNIIDQLQEEIEKSIDSNRILGRLYVSIYRWDESPINRYSQLLRNDLRKQTKLCELKEKAIQKQMTFQNSSEYALSNSSNVEYNFNQTKEAAGSLIINNATNNYNEQNAKKNGFIEDLMIQNNCIAEEIKKINERINSIADINTETIKKPKILNKNIALNQKDQKQIQDLEIQLLIQELKKALNPEGLIQKDESIRMFQNQLKDFKIIEQLFKSKDYLQILVKILKPLIQFMNNVKDNHLHDQLLSEASQVMEEKALSQSENMRIEEHEIKLNKCPSFASRQQKDKQVNEFDNAKIDKMFKKLNNDDEKKGNKYQLLKEISNQLVQTSETFRSGTPQFHDAALLTDQNQSASSVSYCKHELELQIKPKLSRQRQVSQSFSARQSKPKSSKNSELPSQKQDYFIQINDSAKPQLYVLDSQISSRVGNNNIDLQIVDDKFIDKRGKVIQLVNTIDAGSSHQSKNDVPRTSKQNISQTKNKSMRDPIKKNIPATKQRVRPPSSQVFKKNSNQHQQKLLFDKHQNMTSLNLSGVSEKKPDEEKEVPHNKVENVTVESINTTDCEKGSSSNNQFKQIIDNTSPEKLYRVGIQQPKIYKPLKERSISIGSGQVLKENDYQTGFNINTQVDQRQIKCISASSIKKEIISQSNSYRSYQKSNLKGSVGEKKSPVIESNVDEGSFTQQLVNASSQSIIITVSALQKSIVNQKEIPEIKQVQQVKMKLSRVDK